MHGAKKISSHSAKATRLDEDRVRLLRAAALETELNSAALDARESGGSINPYAAAHITYEALLERTLPPEIVVRWLLNGLAKYLQFGGAESLDTTLGLKGTVSGKTSASKRAFLKQRNDVFAGLIQLLTTNGAGVESAAELIWGRDKLLRSLAPNIFSIYPPLSSDEKAIETLTKYWHKSWKKKQSGNPQTAVNVPLLPYDGGTWAADAVQFIWLNVPQWGWPMAALEKARKSGLRI